MKNPCLNPLPNLIHQISTNHESDLEEESDYVGSSVAESEREHVSPAVSSAQIHSETDTSHLVSKDMAKNRLQAASKEKLMQAMGQKVAALLVLPRSTSFALSLTAKAAFRPNMTIPSSVSVLFHSLHEILLIAKLLAGFRIRHFDEILSLSSKRRSPTYQFRPE